MDTLPPTLPTPPPTLPVTEICWERDMRGTARTPETSAAAGNPIDCPPSRELVTVAPEIDRSAPEAQLLRS
ncbi:hypothetical protein AB0I81_62710, partial [Nonomuraea sp. NPDC050404]|uniref:hypothetical protein n=1 Tax=Nonomuraea sp. NPDC050404 TaxID=3155783 RepID=UPI0033C2A524